MIELMCQVGVGAALSLFGTWLAKNDARERVTPATTNPPRRRRCLYCGGSKSADQCDGCGARS